MKLGVGIDESRDAGQTGPCARAHATPANSDADCACCDSVPTHNAAITGASGIIACVRVDGLVCRQPVSNTYILRSFQMDVVENEHQAVK